MDSKKQNHAQKTPMHLLPTSFLVDTATVMGIGAKKYGAWNWHKEQVEAMTYVAAMMRHLCQFIDGEEKDAESGKSHIAHIAANCAILLDAATRKKLIDNRPLK